MASAFVRATIERQLLDSYPVYAAALTLFRTLRGVMGRISTQGRQQIAHVLVVMGAALDQLLRTATTLVAPQLIQIQRLARACRDLAMQAVRYASLSTGTLNVYLSSPARGVLTLFEQNDPARGVALPLIAPRDVLVLMHGVSVF